MVSSSFHSKKKEEVNNRIIYLCVFLSCMVPRYIATFKIQAGINISYYAVTVVLAWLLTTHRIVVKRKLEYIFIYIWFAIILFSVWRAQNYGLWAYYVYWSLTAIFLQQCIIKIKNKNTFEYVIRALITALFLHLLMGLYEVTTHEYLFQTGNIARRLYGHVAIGMFHNLNDYATFVTTMLPLVIYRFLVARKYYEKGFCGGLAISSLYLLIVSESRGVMFTLIAFVCGGIFLFARRSKKNTVISIGGLIIFLVVLLFNGNGRTAIFNLIYNNRVFFDGSRDVGRINLIRNGLYFLRQTYGFGVGAGNLNYWLDQKAIYYIGHLRLIHNWYAEVLVTFGVPFFIVYLAFHITILYKLFSNNYGKSQLKTTLLLSFICFSIVSISSSSNVYSEWVWMYLVIMSLYSASLKKSDI